MSGQKAARNPRNLLVFSRAKVVPNSARFIITGQESTTDLPVVNDRDKSFLNWRKSYTIFAINGLANFHNDDTM